MGMFSVTPYGIYLMGAFIEGATHRQYQRGLIELGILNRTGNAVSLEVSGSTGHDDQGMNRTS